ncbi:MAG: DNA primase [Oscillospiraceae bacterium]|nr:DNA primase [Oscillospiraceae bacterium]
MALPEEFLMEIRARNDIEGVVGAYVSLRRAGHNLIGLCPFHNEKTPSFTIYPENDSFYCFGCGVGGDVITFTKNIENLDYIEAVKKLAERAGMRMPEEQYDTGLADAKRRLRELNREAARFFYNSLISAHNTKGLDYIKNRGASENSIKRFGLGYAPDSWDSLVKHLGSKGFSDEDIALADLGRRNRNNTLNDRFRDRLMFPIIDLQGNIIAFGGRDLSGESKAKYVNTGDTLLYKKTANLFALNLAKKTAGDTLILGEGYMDVLSMHQAGFTNAVASCGTALTEQQAALLAKYAKAVIIAYDADAAGQKAVKRAIPLLRKVGLSIKILVVNGGKDPDEYIRSNGSGAFKALLERAVSDVEYLLLDARGSFNLEVPEGKVAYLNAAVPLLAALESPLERDAYSGKLAEELSVEKSAILQQIDYSRRKGGREERRKRSSELVKQVTGRSDKINRERAQRLSAADSEDKLIAYLFQNQQDFEYIISKLPPEGMSTEFNRRVYKRFAELYRQFGKVEITGFASVFSEAEYGAVYRITEQRNELRYNREDAERWIDVILNESSKPSEKEIAESTVEDLNKKVQELKKRKT